MPAIQTPKNICTPENIFGPYEQTLFCGCSVMNFEATAGWNNDGITTVTVTVAEDPCSTAHAAQKKYYDSNLNVQYTTGPDPGFIEPSIGAPAYFRVGDFEFCGLVQSWRKLNDVNGMPTYEIRLTAPTDILNGMQLIINDYAGTVNYYDVNLKTTLGLYNVFNVYGFMEQFGYYCPQTEIYGAIFGTPANAYGGALVNDNGMSWNRIKQGISMLTSSFPILPTITPFSSYGRIMFCGAAPGHDGYGVMRYDYQDPMIPLYYENHQGYMAQYLLDISEVPAAPDYWRLSGTNISMLDAISQVCQDAGCDFYVELIPIKWAGTVLKFIKVRTVSRYRQPTLGAIESFIGNVGGCISNSIGNELRNEPTTSMLIGGNVQSIYQAISGNPGVFIGPYFGVDSNKNLNPYWKNSYGDWEVEVDITALNAQLFAPLYVNSVTVDESEMRAAIESVDTWQTWAYVTQSDLGKAIEARHGAGKEHLVTSDDIANILTNIGAGKMMPTHWLNWASIYSKYGIQQHDIDKIYQFISTFAREHYGKQFLVKLPYTCTYTDPESLTVNITETPSTDGGWTEYANIIGLPHPTVYTDFFSNSDKGLIGPFAKFNNITGLDTVEVPVDDVGVYNYALYVKADIAETILYENYTTKYGPYVLITLPNPIFVKEQQELSLANCSFIRELCTRKGYDIPNLDDTLNEMGEKFNANNAMFGLYRKAAVPSAAAIPLRSTVSTYGPWVRRGPAGAVRVERDDGLVPWEYGGMAGLNTAGMAKVNTAMTAMQVSELGEVTIPGYPTLPLGAELGSYTALGGKQLIENRTVSSENFDEGSSNITYYYSNQQMWEGRYGPNITNIQVRVGPQGIQTTYQMRTFTPVAGRFSKAHIERFRQLTGQRAKFLKQQRNRAFVLGRIETARRYFKGIDSQRRRGESSVTPESNNTIFGGQMNMWDKVLDDNALRLTSVGSLPLKEISSERAGFEEKAFMSMDGLLRPVSKSGDGDLPRYVSYTSDPCVKIPHQSESINPPINSYTPLDISTLYLDPVAGTNSPKHGTSLGHDIQLLAHGDGTTLTSLNCHINELGLGYTEPTDYRFLALRGPLVIHGWGYDLQGKPIPNAADDEESCAIGDFMDEDLKDTFLTDWMRKSHTWPVAPVDLRYDRKRGVWTVPNGFRIIQATADSDIAAGQEGTCTPTNMGTVYDANGAIVASPKITVKCLTAVDAQDQLFAYFDTNDCKYYAITPGGGGGQLNVSDVDCLNITQIDQDPASHLIFGSGIWLNQNPFNSTEFIVNAGHEFIRDTGTSFSTSEELKLTDSWRQSDLITIGRGLRASVPQTCGMVLESYLDIKNVACNAIVYENSDPGLNWERAQKINFGRGLLVTEIQENYVYNVETYIRVGYTRQGEQLPALQPIDMIEFQECFDVVYDNEVFQGTHCKKASVTLYKPPIGTVGNKRVRVVKTIDCIGRELSCYYTDLEFSACGLFIGTVNPADTTTVTQ